jgi:hypothetical protein
VKSSNSRVNLKTLLAVAASATMAFAMAACGGANGGISANPAPPPNSGPYTPATLNGSYAFQMSGQDGGGPFARVGSFTANGSGSISGGIEDVNSNAIPGAATLAFTSGSYTMSSNGKGTLTLTNSTGSLGFSIVMTSTTAGFITQTDGTATASGNFTIQDASTFGNFATSINGPYVFDFAGLSPQGFGESLIGQFNANGAGGVGSGIVDINNGAVASGVLPITGAVFTADSANVATTGRGIATLTANGQTFNFAIYLVSAGRIRFIRTDFPAVATGDAVAQTGTIPTTSAALSGSFAFVLSGASISGNDVRAGRMTLNGGLIDTTSLIADDDDSSASGSGNSSYTKIPNGSLSAATYAIDTANAGTGRGTLTFTDSKAGTFTFIFYLSSPTQGVVQDNSPGIVSDGTIMAQTGGPFTTSALAGNWALNLAGTSVNGTTGGFGEEDFLGQYTLSNAGAISGGVDFTEISASSVVTNAGITGVHSVAGDGTQRNPYTFTISASPSATLNFSAYQVDANTFFVVGTDTHRVIAGTVARNF